MIHDFSKVFDTDNPAWLKVLEIFERNECFDKKKTPGRALHHKFPKSFSKMLNEEIDNEPDNLISLEYKDHFLLHYYYYRLAKEGGCKQRMALAFKYMVEADGMPKEEINDKNLEVFMEAYNDATIKACELYSSIHKGKTISEEQKKIIAETMRNRIWTDEQRKRMSEQRKGRKLSDYQKQKLKEANTGRICSEETHKKKIGDSCRGKKLPFTPEHLANVRAAAERRRGRKLSEETKEKMRQNRKGKKYVIINGKRVREDKVINNVEENNE